MKVIFSNISGGFIFAGQHYGEMLFRQLSLRHYIEQYRQLQPDILALTEVHIEPDGRSEMAERLSRDLGLPYYRVLELDDSMLDTSKRLGTAILTRYPIERADEFTIPSPKLEVDRPNGDHWVMHDKGAQRVVLDVDGNKIGLIVFWYFPFHHFGRRMDEAEFAPLRQQLLDILLSDSKLPTIVIGDFNNKGVGLRQGFPELFVQDRLRQAVQVPTTLVGHDHDQVDNILYQPQFFEASGGFAQDIGSDHLAVGAQIILR